MSGLLLGIVSGSIIAGATLAGAMPVFIKQQWKGLEKMKLDFFVGLLLLAAAAGHLSSALILSFLLGIFFIMTSRQLIENVVMPLMSVTHIEYRAFVILMMLLCKNIADGLAAGAVFNISHSGISHSLLSGIILQDLIDGLTFAVNLMVLEVSPLMSVVGALASGAVEFFSAIFGSYFSKEFSEALPLLLSFSAGALMSSVVEETASLAIGQTKHILRPRLVNGLVVLLILIVGKELL